MPTDAGTRPPASFFAATLAFLAMPGVVAFALPALWLANGTGLHPAHPWGFLLLGGGAFALLWSVRDFYVAGRGTLAPWRPPVDLVVVGLYRWSRNPMYVAVLTILAGWATAFASLPLAAYGCALAVAFELRIRWGEEPWLERRHGSAWLEYRRRVRRWI